MSLNNKSVYFSLNPNWAKVCKVCWPVQSETSQNMVICNRTIRLSCRRRLWVSPDYFDRDRAHAKRLISEAHNMVDVSAQSPDRSDWDSGGAWAFGLPHDYWGEMLVPTGTDIVRYTFVRHNGWAKWSIDSNRFGQNRQTYSAWNTFGENEIGRRLIVWQYRDIWPGAELVSGVSVVVLGCGWEENRENETDFNRPIKSQMISLCYALFITIFKWQRSMDHFCRHIQFDFYSLTVWRVTKTRWLEDSVKKSRGKPNIMLL